MNFGGTAQTKRTQMVDRMALRFSKTDPGKCKFEGEGANRVGKYCLLYTSPSPRDRQKSRMPSSA